MSAVDFRELYAAFDALDAVKAVESLDSLSAIGSVGLDHGPDPVRHYSPEPAADSPAPRSYREPVPALCQWCGCKPYRCVCSSSYEDLP